MPDGRTQIGRNCAGRWARACRSLISPPRGMRANVVRRRRPSFSFWTESVAEPPCDAMTRRRCRGGGSAGRSGRRERRGRTRSEKRRPPERAHKLHDDIAKLDMRGGATIVVLQLLQFSICAIVVAFIPALIDNDRRQVNATRWDLHLIIPLFVAIWVEAAPMHILGMAGLIVILALRARHLGLAAI